MKRINYEDYKRQSDYLTFGQGDNVVRLVSDGFYGIVYKMKTKNALIKWTNWEDIPEQYRDNVEGAERWTWVAINRSTGQVGVMEVGATIGDELILKIQEKKLDPLRTDFLIHRKGEGFKTEYTIAVAPETKPFTDKEKQLIQSRRIYLLKKYIDG